MEGTGTVLQPLLESRAHLSLSHTPTHPPPRVPMPKAVCALWGTPGLAGGTGGGDESCEHQPFPLPTAFPLPSHCTSLHQCVLDPTGAGCPGLTGGVPHRRSVLSLTQHHLPSFFRGECLLPASPLEVCSRMSPCPLCSRCSAGALTRAGEGGTHPRRGCRGVAEPSSASPRAESKSSVQDNCQALSNTVPRRLVLDGEPKHAGLHRGRAALQTMRATGAR